MSSEVLAIREAAPSHVLLKIESFSLIDKWKSDRYESSKFDAANKKWRLIINTNGSGTEKRCEYVSVYLAILGTGLLPEKWEVNAVFSIFILNQISGNYHHTTGNNRRFFPLKTEWGVPNLISKKDLMNPSNGYLIDDCCVFGAEVFVINNIKAVSRCLSVKNLKVPYTHAINISKFSKLKGKIWRSEEFSAGGYKWKMILYPNGCAEETKRSLSVYLEYVPSNNKNSSDERVKVRFTICMKNQLSSDKNRKYSTSHWFDASNINWGFRSFILLDTLNSECGGFIVKDTCLFEIEIFVLAVAK